MTLLGLGESCEKISEKYCYTNAGGNWNGERGGEQRDVFVSENRKFLVLFMSKLPLNLRKLCTLPEHYLWKSSIFPLKSIWQCWWHRMNVLLISRLTKFCFINSCLWTWFCKRKYFCLFIVNNCTCSEEVKPTWRECNSKTLVRLG